MKNHQTIPLLIDGRRHVIGLDVDRAGDGSHSLTVFVDGRVPPVVNAVPVPPAGLVVSVPVAERMLDVVVGPGKAHLASLLIL